MEKPTLFETFILPPDHPLNRRPAETESRVDHTMFSTPQEFDAAYPRTDSGLGKRGVASTVQLGSQVEHLIEQEAA